MKVSKLFAALFAVLGAVVMVGGVILCFVNRNAVPDLGAMTAGADTCAESFLTALAAGDTDTAQGLLYGGASLDIRPNDGGDPIWSAYYDRFSYAFSGTAQVSGTEITREVTITALDIPSLTAGLSTRARELLKARVEAEEDPSVLYGEDDMFLPEVVEPVMAEALSAALAQDAQTRQRTCVLQLYQDGAGWKVIPDGNLALALSGGVN